MKRYVVIIVAQVVITTAARALSLEGVMAAHDAVPIVDLVAAKSRAHGAPLGDVHAIGSSELVAPC